MTPSRLLTGCLLVSVLAWASGIARGEEPEARPSAVDAVIYEVFHGDSLHRLGTHVREIHVPSRNFAFYVWQGELRVFRPKAHRYRLPGDEMTLRIPGCETRRVGVTRLRVEDADRLEAHLQEKETLRALADRYLQAHLEYELVVGFRDLDTTAAEIVFRLLEGAGMRPCGTSMAGGTQVHVPASRAEEARRLLREAQAKEPLLGFQVMDRNGTVEWTLDRTRVPPVPPHVDVLEHLARFPGKYGDSDLERAEEVLTGRVPRPWTVEALLRAYGEATDETVRAALIYLLAASRSAEALSHVGAALTDDALPVRVQATYGILTWWDEEGIPAGGTEQAMERAQAWWKTRAR